MEVTEEDIRWWIAHNPNTVLQGSGMPFYDEDNTLHTTQLSLVPHGQVYSVNTTTYEYWDDDDKSVVCPDKCKFIDGLALDDAIFLFHTQLDRLYYDTLIVLRPQLRNILRQEWEHVRHGTMRDIFLFIQRGCLHGCLKTPHNEDLIIYAMFTPGPEEEPVDRDKLEQDVTTYLG